MNQLFVKKFIYVPLLAVVAFSAFVLWSLFSAQSARACVYPQDKKIACETACPLYHPDCFAACRNVYDADLVAYNQCLAADRQQQDQQQQNQTQQQEQQPTQDQIDQNNAVKEQMQQQQQQQQAPTPRERAPTEDQCKAALQVLSVGDPGYNTCRNKYPDLPTANTQAVRAAAQNVQVIEGDNVEDQAIIEAPDDAPVDIALPNGDILMEQGARIERIGEIQWRTLDGSFKFNLRGLQDFTFKPVKFKLITTFATIDDNGTQFFVDTTADGVTTVKVLQGSVVVKPLKGGKKITVKAGFQTTINAKGVARPVKIPKSGVADWSQDIPPSQGFLDDSFKKTAAADKYQSECSFNFLTPIQLSTLTEERQKLIDNLKDAVARYRGKITQSLIAREKKLFFHQEKTNSIGTRVFEYKFQSDKIYYSGDKPGTWKWAEYKKLIDSAWPVVLAHGITSPLDKSSLQFQSWQNAGNSRQAIYSGRLTAEVTNDIIGLMLPNFKISADQNFASVRVSIDENSGLVSSYDVNVNEDSGGPLIFPLRESCRVKYGAAVKITMPTKAKVVGLSTVESDLTAGVESVK